MRPAFCIKITLLFLMVLLSCNPDPGPTNIDTYVDFRVYNKTGDNLLDPLTSGYYKPEDIRIYFLKDGVKKEAYNPALDAPRNFRIFDNGANQNYLRLFPDEGTKDQETTTTLLLWREGDQDTIKTTMTRIQGSVYTKKVYFNSVLKYDVNTSQPVNWGLGTFKRLIDVQK